MSHPTTALGTTPITEVPAIPLRRLAPWALFATLLASVVLTLAGVDLAALGVPGGGLIHEVAHDGRHLLGYPCH